MNLGVKDLKKLKGSNLFVEKINLTPEEAQVFWPVYNEFDKKRYEIHKKSHDLGKDIHDNFDSYTDKDFRKFLTEMENQDLAEVNLAKEYNDKFLKILPVLFF